MNYIGDFRLGDTLDCKFCTVTTTGAPTTLAGTPVVSAYPGNSLTQLTAGITLTVDFDAVTGLHNVRVVATGANGYATATNYALVITTGTVGGTSVVGYVVGEFSIENRSAVMPTTAARTLDVSAGGEAGVDWANIGSPTTAQNLSATNIDVDQIVASVSGAVGSVTGAVGSVTGAVGSVAAGGIATTSFAAGAIDNAAFNVTETLTANPAAGGIVAASFGAGAIDAAAIAADAIGASELAADAANEIADALLARNVAGGSSTGRIVSEALYVLRNRTAIAAGTLTVYGTNDTTAAFTATVTTAAGNPITEIDPV
mgnify:FL=1